MNKKTLLTLVGAVTASTIVFYTYKAYKMYKHIKAEEITAEEVMKVIEERKLQKQAEETAKALEEREARKDISVEEYYEEEDEEVVPLVQYEYEEYLRENGEVEETYEEDEEELDILRYEPNSQQAKDQYLMLLLSDFDRYSRDYKLLNRLLRVPFSGDPKVNGFMLDNIVEVKEHFYGPDSKWLDQTSWGDVILYFSDRASFDLGNSRDYWFGVFMDTIGFSIDDSVSDQEFDEIVDSIRSNYFYGANYGIFGLSRDQVLEAGRFDSIQNINQLSVERQYQEYVKQELEDM